MKQSNFLSTGLGVFLCAILANLLWGSASPCIKLGYRFFQIPSDAVMSQFLFAGIRFTLAGILTVLFGSLAEHHLLVPKKNNTGMILVLALTQTIIQYTLFYMGLSRTPGFKGSVISPSSVFFAVLLASLVFRQEKLTVRKLFGCLVGFIGVVLINIRNAAGISGFQWNGEGFLLLSTFSYACSSVLTKRFSARENPIALSGYQFILGGTVMVLISLLAGGRLYPVSAKAWLLMLYLGLLSAVAYTLWALLLQRHPVSHITVYSFANPIFGVFLSAVLLDEGKQLNLPLCMLSLLLVSLGIWVVNSSRPLIRSRVISSGRE